MYAFQTTFAPAIQRYRVKARDETEQKPGDYHEEKTKYIGCVYNTRPRPIIVVAF